MGAESLPPFADLWAWYSAVSASWVGYAIGAAVASSLLLGVAMGLIGSATAGKDA